MALTSNSALIDWSAITLSIRVSLVATLLCLIPGVLTGVWLARTRSRWRTVVEITTVAPLVVPPVVIGFLLLIVFRAIDRSVVFTWWAAVIASAIVSIPLLIRTVRATVETLDPRLTLAAATLGASRFRVLRTITIPLAWRGIIAGATLAWARAIGEFGATIVVAGNIPGQTRTIPLAIWTAIQSPTAPSPAPLVIAAIALAVAAVALSEWLVRRARPESAHARSENP